MDKKLFAADDFLLQYANSHQFFQITRCSLANGDFPFGHVLNAAVWQFEYQIDQVVAVSVFGSCMAKSYVSPLNTSK